MPMHFWFTKKSIDMPLTQKNPMTYFCPWKMHWHKLQHVSCSTWVPSARNASARATKLWRNLGEICGMIKIRIYGKSSDFDGKPQCIYIIYIYYTYIYIYVPFLLSLQMGGNHMQPPYCIAVYYWLWGIDVTIYWEIYNLWKKNKHGWEWDSHGICRIVGWFWESVESL